MSFADRLRELRTNNRYSQEQLAEKLCVSRQAISKWETGDSLPDIDKAMAISEFFGVSMDNHFSAVPVGKTERTAAIGDSVTLAVNVTADDVDDLLLIWLKLERVDDDGTRHWRAIHGANTDSLTVNVATATDTYMCDVFDGYGHEEEVIFTVKAVDSTDPVKPVDPVKPIDTDTSTSGSSEGVTATGTLYVTTDLSNINKVSVDGKAVAEKYYTISNNVVILSEEFMATLSSGKHTITAENDTHVSTATFVVDNPAAQSPKTGDMGVMVYGLLSVLSTAGVVTIYKKKERK